MKKKGKLREKLDKLRFEQKINRVFKVTIRMMIAICVVSIIGLSANTYKAVYALTMYGYAQGRVGEATTALAEDRWSMVDIQLAVLDEWNGYDSAEMNYRLERSKKEFDTAMSELKAMGKGKKEGDQFHKIEQQIKEYDEKRQEIIEKFLTWDSETARSEENIRILYNELDPKYEPLHESLDGLLQMKTKEGQNNSFRIIVYAVTNMIFSITVTIIAILINRRLSKYIAQSIASPINQCIDRMKKFAAGDLDSVLEDLDTEDESKELICGIRDSIAEISNMIGDLSRGLDKIGNNNFDIVLECEYPGEFSKLAESLGNCLVHVSDTLEQIDESASSVEHGTEQIAQGARLLTEGATEQAAAIEELQATLIEISGTVTNNATNAVQANDKAKEVEQAIHYGNEQMKNLVHAMEEISENSEKINGIIGTINEIAEQTNLLALNASIEAARAGEQGKGFAVVAGEVGKLANDCTAAVQRSAELIEDAIRCVEDGKKITYVTAKKLIESVEQMGELALGINDISKESERQAESIEQITLSIEQIASVIQENTAMAEESSSSSSEIAAQAKRLNELVEQFERLSEDSPIRKSINSVGTLS